MIADMGFSITFSRVIAYAMGGAEKLKGYIDIDQKAKGSEPNWNTMAKICASMNKIYFRIASVWCLLLLSIGTLSVFKPITQNEGHMFQGWAAWVIVIVTSTFRVYGNQYTSYLIGTNRIALHKRWETSVWLASIAINIIVLLLGGGLLALVTATQGLLAVNVLVNLWLFRSLSSEHYRQFKGGKLDRGILSEIWPATWRSGFGIILGAGLIQCTGIFYAQVGSKESVAAYLLALYLMRAISQFSQAPFYSKIPALSRLRAEGQLIKQQKLAEQGMRLSYYTVAVGIILIGIFGPPLLKCIKSNADFVDGNLWALMGLAAFLERYGAMHIQLYSTTNHIITHIANGVTGLIFILAVALSYVFLGVYAFPISQIVANLAFYNWYAVKHSYSAFRLRFWDFEGKTAMVPFIALLLYFSMTMFGLQL